MKFHFAIVLLLCKVTMVYSQEKFLPQIKKGTVLTYQVSAGGQLFPIQMRIDSLTNEYARFYWSMQDGAAGHVINTKASMENAIKGFWGNLNAGEEQTMPSDQAIIMASRAMWNMAQKDKKFNFDMQDFMVKEQPAGAVFKLGDKIVNVLYAETANSATKVWFLNNPSAPILLKIEGNPQGIEVFLQSIE